MQLVLVAAIQIWLPSCSGNYNNATTSNKTKNSEGKTFRSNRSSILQSLQLVQPPDAGRNDAPKLHVWEISAQRKRKARARMAHLLLLRVQWQWAVVKESKADGVVSSRAISTHRVGASDPNNTEREREARRNAHGLYPEVGDGAGDALPDTGVGVAAPPAGEPMMHGGVEGQLELQQRLACEQETVGQRLISKRRGQRVAA